MEKPKYPLNQVYFYLTEGCNLRCRHCWLAPKHQSQDRIYQYLSTDHIASVVTQGKPLGLSGVKLTGGEPFLHPEIFKIIKMIREAELALTIESNGTLCTADLAKEIALSKKRFVSVSLDGAKKETHEKIRGVKGSFDLAIQGIQHLVEAGIRPQIILTLMRINYQEVEKFLKLAESLGASSVKFNVLQPTARGETLHHAKENLTLSELLKLQEHIDTTLSKTVKIPIYFDLPMAFRPLGKVFNPESPCGVCGILGILGVLYNGSYALCGIGEHIKELVFGHVEKDELKEVWNHNPTLCSIREGLPKQLKGVCQQCLLNNFCRGACLAQNYYASKNLWSSYWLCEEAFRNGCFPTSRLK